MSLRRLPRSTSASRPPSRPMIAWKSTRPGMTRGKAQVARRTLMIPDIPNLVFSGLHFSGRRTGRPVRHQGSVPRQPSEDAKRGLQTKPVISCIINVLSITSSSYGFRLPPLPMRGGASEGREAETNPNKPKRVNHHVFSSIDLIFKKQTQTAYTLLYHKLTTKKDRITDENGWADPQILGQGGRRREEKAAGAGSAGEGSGWARGGIQDLVSVPFALSRPQSFPHRGLGTRDSARRIANLFRGEGLGTWV